MSKKIGDVHVDVHFQSDGKELRDDVRKDPSFKEAGKSAAEQVDEGYDDQWTQDLAERVKKQEQFDKRSIAAQKGWETRRANMSRDTTESMVKDSEGFFARLRNGWVSAREEQKKTDGETKGFFRNLEQRSQGFGNTIGKMFGKGARNNFVNFIGIVAGALGQIPNLALKGFAGVGDALAKDVSKPLEESAGIAEGLGGSLAELAAMGPEIAIGLGAALIVLPGILALVASAIMLVTGAVIALAGALSVALVGAIAVAAAALVPLAAGIGVTILAFKNMSKEQKKAFDGIKGAFSDLGKVAANHLFKNAAEDAKLLEKALKPLKPLVANVADAVRQVAEGFLKAMSGPGAKQFVGFLSKVLPGMIKQIGRIAQNLGQFLGEAFMAVTPLVQEFLGWLEGVSKSLADMGKGGKGSKLADFFSGIGPIMDQVGGAIGQVAGLIADLFMAGAGTGGDMFQSLGDQVKKFRDYLAQAKKDGSLQKFFDDAKKFGSAIGDAVVAVGQLIAALDTPEGRKFLTFMVRSFTTTIRLITQFIRLEEQIMHGFEAIGRVIGRAFMKGLHGAMDAFHAMVRAGRNAKDAITGAFSNLGGWFASKFRAVAHAGQTAFNSIKTAVTGAAHWVSQKASDIAASVRAIPGKVGNIASKFGSMAKAWGTAIVNALKGVPGDIVALFNGLAGKIVSTIGSINLFPHINWPSPPGWLSKLTATGGVFSGAQMRIIGERGPEAVVPLSGPLSAVDPSVRALAAFARGGVGQSGGSSSGRVQRGIDVGGITIVTPTKDPRAVAAETINRLVAIGY